MIKLNCAATGHPLLVNPKHIVLVQNDEEDDQREVILTPEGVANLYVTETVDEVLALIKSA
jgi:hypothetical protein